MVVALLMAGCGTSPTAPAQQTPPPQPPAAAIGFTGSLSFTNCQQNGELIACDFSGGALNSGDGCAANVRGTTTTYRPKPNDTVIDRTNWAYGQMVKAHASFTYSGRVNVIAAAGTYLTEFQWDNVACP